MPPGFDMSQWQALNLKDQTTTPLKWGVVRANPDKTSTPSASPASATTNRWHVVTPIYSGQPQISSFNSPNAAEAVGPVIGSIDLSHPAPQASNSSLTSSSTSTLDLSSTSVLALPSNPFSNLKPNINPSPAINIQSKGLKRPYEDFKADLREEEAHTFGRAKVPFFRIEDKYAEKVDPVAKATFTNKPHDDVHFLGFKPRNIDAKLGDTVVRQVDDNIFVESQPKRTRHPLNVGQTSDIVELCPTDIQQDPKTKHSASVPVQARFLPNTPTHSRLYLDSDYAQEPVLSSCLRPVKGSPYDPGVPLHLSPSWKKLLTPWPTKLQTVSSPTRSSASPSPYPTRHKSSTLSRTFINTLSETEPPKPKVDTRPIPKCPRHHKNANTNRATSIEDSEDCDSDCYENYDPLDDTAEIGEATRRLEIIGTCRNREKVMPDGFDTTNISTDSSESKSRLRVSLVVVLKMRRPYISARARNWLRQQDDQSFLSSYDGPIHITFTHQEASLVWLTIWVHFQLGSSADFTPYKALQYLSAYGQMSNVSAEDARLATSFLAFQILPYLARRTSEDIIAYINDSIDSFNTPRRTLQRMLRNTSRQPPQDEIVCSYTLIASPSNNGHSLPSNNEQSWSQMRLHRELGFGAVARHTTPNDENLLKRQSKALRLMMPHKVFNEGSNDVITIAWSTRGKFALGTVTSGNDYNRPGNLALGDVDSIKLLHGHYTDRPGNSTVLDPKMYSTVQKVEFSGANQLLSSSFDHTVKIWTADDGDLLNTIKFTDWVTDHSVNKRFEGLFAAGTRVGNVTAVRLDDEGQVTGSETFVAGVKDVSPATMTWSDEWLFVGYDARYDETNETMDEKHGDLRVINTHSGTTFPIRPGTTGHFEICLNATEMLLVVGVMSSIGDKKREANSHVRLFDWKRSLSRYFIELDSPQTDLNRVNISRCGRFVSSSGTDSKTIMWDLRNYKEPLHIFSHGEPLVQQKHDQTKEAQDSGVHLASWYMDNLFVTGGSDGLVKVWNPGKADPFCYDLASVDGPIMSGAFAPDGDMLMVGQSTGTATLLSVGGNGVCTPFLLDTVHDEAIAEEDDTQAGRRAAAELAATGEVVLRGGSWWGRDAPFRIQ